MTVLLYRMLATLAFVAVTAGLSARLVRRLYPGPWHRWARRAFLAGAGLVLVGTFGWFAARALDAAWLYTPSVLVSSSLLVASVILFVTIPLWGTARVATRAIAQRVDNPARRAFLGRASGVLPIAAVASGPTGALASVLAPVLRHVEVPVANLAAGLDGLRILQLTDIHLGTFIDVDQVERVVEAARELAPDLVVLTGDVADDYTKLPAALAAVRGLEAPLGTFGIYGNHEVYRGREACARIYQDAGVPLLVEDGVVLEREGARLWLGGCDDPATLGREHRSFLQGTVRRTLQSCPEDINVRVLLSHRPEGFEEAARHGVNLTLAGHTHGGQMAFFGRSLLEPLLPRNYMLGPYSKGDSHLYTSAGLGHWFPFRMNCPCEAAVVTLRRGSGAARVVEA